MIIPLKQNFDGQLINSSNPLIVTVENFITPSEAEHIVNLARPKMETATVLKPEGRIVDDYRTGKVAFLSHNSDPIVADISQRVAKYVGLPLSHVEDAQIVHYLQGQAYKPHFDAIVNPSEYDENTLLGGQRRITALLYLNHVDAGGETYFPKLGYSHTPEHCSLLMFHNLDEKSNKPEPNSLHGAAPVLSGEKWAMNFWFRQYARN